MVTKLEALLFKSLEVSDCLDDLGGEVNLIKVPSLRGNDDSARMSAATRKLVSMFNSQCYVTIQFSGAVRCKVLVGFKEIKMQDCTELVSYVVHNRRLDSSEYSFKLEVDDYSIIPFGTGLFFVVEDEVIYSCSNLPIDFVKYDFIDVSASFCEYVDSFVSAIMSSFRKINVDEKSEEEELEEKFHAMDYDVIVSTLVGRVETDSDIKLDVKRIKKLMCLCFYWFKSYYGFDVFDKIVSVLPKVKWRDEITIILASEPTLKHMVVQLFEVSDARLNKLMMRQDAELKHMDEEKVTPSSNVMPSGLKRGVNVRRS
jgi:hypothetical protein